MIEAGLWRVHRHKSEVHPWREPRAHYGEMVQMDGSHHDWLEKRGPKLVLMGMVDDARNRFYGRFYEYEGVYPAMNVLEGYLRHFGLPQSLYVDKYSTYKTVRQASENELLPVPHTRGDESIEGHSSDIWISQSYKIYNDHEEQVGFDAYAGTSTRSAPY